MRCVYCRSGGGSKCVHADSTLVGTLCRHLPAALVTPLADYETHVPVHRWCALSSNERRRSCSEHQCSTVHLCALPAAGVWLLAALLASPIAVHARVVELRPGLRKCGEIWSSAELEIAYSITLDVALFGVPLAVMGLTYTLIAVHLTRSLRFASGMANSGASGSGTSKSHTRQLTQ